MLGMWGPKITLDARPRRARRWVALSALATLAALVVPPAWGLEIPDVRGDQLLFFYDAREGHTSFVSITNPANVAVVLELASYPPDLADPLVEIVTLEAGRNRIVDMATAFEKGSVGRAGVLVVTPVAGEKDLKAVVPPAPLAGSFTVAGPQSAFGENAFARSVERRVVAGTIVDGNTVKYAALSPGILMIPVFYDPATLDDPKVDGNRIALIAFVDSYQADGPFRITAPTPPLSLTPTFCVQATGRLEAAAVDVAGVSLTDLQALAGEVKLTSSGSLFFEVADGAANLFGVFSQASGEFAAGQRLPAADQVPDCVATPTPTGPMPTGPTPTQTLVPVPVCGNRTREGLEECDHDDFGTPHDCGGIVGGHCGGVLGCTSDCKFDLSQCGPCSCGGDVDCSVNIDCTSVKAQCKLGGACQDHVCVASQPTGDELAKVCNSVDPLDHKPRCP